VSGLTSNLENFRPKLRPGRVIPQGSRIVFETDNPYNQVILPMALADLILLCSGKFSVREIVAKIYKKQGAVPFKSILTALHVLHQGGFFENAHELVLSSDLQSWMEPKRSRWHFSWRFGQRIVSDIRSTTSYYVFTLVMLIGAIVGLQLFPSSPFVMIEAWTTAHDPLTVLSSLLIASSALLSLKYTVRGIQLLLLTGKAYNVSFRLSPFGFFIHVGNEANDLFENRLFTAMFYVSQISVPWLFTFLASYALPSSSLEPYIIMAFVLTFWEMNPFQRSDGFKLVQSLLLPTDRDVASWHFETSQLINSMSSDQRRQDQDFARICAIWGAIWLVLAFSVLHQSAITFGPKMLSHLGDFTPESVFPTLGMIAWLVTLYLVVQAFVEIVVVSLVRPHWRNLNHSFKQITSRARSDWSFEKISGKIESLPLFSHFHEQYLKRIVEQSEVLEYSRGSVVIRQGDPSRELYVLLEGDVVVSRKVNSSENEWVSELSTGSIFGETSLVDDLPRQAQVIAKSEIVVLRVPIEMLRAVAHEAQSIRHLDDFRNAILVNQFFASSPVFRSLSVESIDFLSSRGTLEYFDQGQSVFMQGDNGDSLYLILRGSVDVLVHEIQIKRLYQGSFFGEIALIANIPRTATISTAEPCVFFKISSDAFWEVLVQHMDLGVFLETVSESRLREDLEMAALRPTGSDS
jgi:CRP-like cAMP-binding protein